MMIIASSPSRAKESDAVGYVSTSVLCRHNNRPHHRIPSRLRRGMVRQQGAVGRTVIVLTKHTYLCCLLASLGYLLLATRLMVWPVWTIVQWTKVSTYLPTAVEKYTRRAGASQASCRGCDGDETREADHSLLLPPRSQQAGPWQCSRESRAGYRNTPSRGNVTAGTLCADRYTATRGHRPRRCGSKGGSRATESE